MYQLIYLVIYCVLYKQVSSHGMMLEPPNRSSLWRFDKNAPANYEDNQNYCGGFVTQWNQFKGKCGVCGDPYNEPHPQKNENGGAYGQGKVVRQYKSGSIINVEILLTQNHLGYFSYSLCELKNHKAPESGEDCFKPLLFANGSSKFSIFKNDRKLFNKIKLPKGFKCKRCVLRWTYTTGNNWGRCLNGSEQIGCGPQETFRSCSDIAIV